MCGHGRKSDGMKTLNLGLDEVAHIRSALTKAELEGIDDAVREDIENGRVRKPSPTYPVKGIAILIPRHFCQIFWCFKQWRTEPATNPVTLDSDLSTQN